MANPRKRVFILSLVGALVLGAWLVQLHFVADHAGATVFQRGDEAYLFLGGGHTGWHFPALLFPLVIAQGYFRVPADISDQNAQSLVIRVTPGGVERWVNKPVSAAFLTPFEDGFYALCPGAILCKWTEKDFVRASPEEEKRIRIEDLNRSSLDNRVINGWSTYGLKYSPGDHFEVRLSKDLVIAVQNIAKTDREYPNVTVDLLRPGRAPEKLHHADENPRLVSRSEYEELLGKR